jgi:hypothetical protein
MKCFQILKRERPMINMEKKVCKEGLSLRALLTFSTCLAWGAEEEVVKLNRKDRSNHWLSK